MKNEILKSQPPPNVADSERIGSAAVGAGIALFGLGRRNAWTPLLLWLGGLLIKRGATGRCGIYRQLGIDTAPKADTGGVASRLGIRIEQSIEVACSPWQVFGYWRSLDNLPKFMPHLISVTELDDRLSHWIVAGPAGIEIEWDAEIINERTGELIAWQTRPGAQVRSAGTIRFEPLREGATKLTVVLEYQPPAGQAGALVAHIFGMAPDQQLKNDLARFRELAEADRDATENKIPFGRRPGEEKDAAKPFHQEG